MTESVQAIEPTIHMAELPNKPTEQIAPNIIGDIIK